MAFWDAAIIVAYFIVIIGVGFVFQKRASKNLESYFLGGKKIHWLALSMSGSVSNFDITGTMWISSLLFVLGMKSMWVHWMWGFMLSAFCLAFMAKWVRRSNVMTAAEWMVTRFGDNRGGRFARSAYALMAVLTQASFVGYAFQGIGKFASIYVPFSPNVCATVVIGVTTFYVILGGLYSVVVTDVIQTFVLTFAALLIAAIAFTIVSPEQIKEALPSDFASMTPTWTVGADSESQYFFFGPLLLMWVIKGFFLNAGGPAQMYDFQRFLAAASPRDAAKAAASWSFFLIPRWAMVMAITLLAATGFSDVTDPEKIMPMVLQQYLPVGVRGLVIAGLIAAFMSTFSSTVNSGASFIVRDLWEPAFGKNASQEKLVWASQIATILLVLLGVVIGFQAESISSIWNWMMMALGAGVIIPNFLRWYWWRLNGWGYTFGTFSGIFLSCLVLLFPEAPPFVVFPIICLASLIGCVQGSLLTEPVPIETLKTFYEKVRPFGVWGPFKQKSSPSEGFGRAAFNTLVAIVTIYGIYLGPMYLVGHWYSQALGAFVVSALGCLVLYKTWYPYLPDEGEVE